MAKKASKPQTALATQKELIIVMVLSLVLGLGGGYLIGNATAGSDTTTAESSAPAMKHSHSHEHSKFEVPADQAPTVQLEVTEDAKSGYNVRVVTSNFIFAPQSVNQENVLGEGHAHLYVGDELVARLYGPDFHYRGHFDGTKTFRVTLNTNDHSDYAVNGEVIEASVDVTHDSSDHDHDDDHSSDSMHSMDSMNKPE